MCAEHAKEEAAGILRDLWHDGWFEGGTDSGDSSIEPEEDSLRDALKHLVALGLQPKHLGKPAAAQEPV
jgi:hypothetical protein